MAAEINGKYITLQSSKISQFPNSTSLMEAFFLQNEWIVRIKWHVEKSDSKKIFWAKCLDVRQHGKLTDQSKEPVMGSRVSEAPNTLKMASRDCFQRHGVFRATIKSYPRYQKDSGAPVDKAETQLELSASVATPSRPFSRSRAWVPIFTSYCGQHHR